MTPIRFSVQAAIVTTMVLLVSFPEQRALQGVSVWRANGPLAAGRSAGGIGPRPSGDGVLRRQYEIGYGSASVERASAAGSSAVQRKLYGYDVEGRRRSFTTPRDVLLLGGTINAIIGLARTSMNAPLPYARLLLRSIVTGDVEARATADGDGRFTFLDLVPSGYVVELLDPDGSVVATSELVSVGLGDLLETIVRAPGDTVLAAFRRLASTVDEPLAVAADKGVNRVTQPDRSLSPQR